MFEIKFIESGYFMADGGAMFGAVPKRAWSRKYPCKEDNLCPLAMRCLLAISNEKRILIDLGMGDKHLDKVQYYQPHLLTDIPETLKNYGYTPEEITDVIISHLHFDHCGYATRQNKDGKVIPSFPKARYWVSQQQWEHFLQPNLLEKDAFFPENIQPIYDSGLLQLIEKDSEITKGVKIRLFNGHTPGQLVTYIETTTGITVFPGDLIPTAAHLSPEWISAFDICAITALHEKIRFLKEAADRNYTLAYYHDAQYISSQVKSSGNKENPIFRKVNAIRANQKG